MIKRTVLSYPSADGRTAIHAVEWAPAGAVRGVVQLSHGIASHVLRLEDFALFLASRGYVVCGNDHLGHGGSRVGEEDLGYFADRDGWLDAVRDMRTLYKFESSRYGGAPYFMFGHSMGSFLVRTYLTLYPGGLDGCVLCGTGQQPRPVLELGRVLCGAEAAGKGGRCRIDRAYGLCMRVFSAGLDGEDRLLRWVSRDGGAVESHKTDETCMLVPTAGLCRDMIGGMRYNSDMRNLLRMDKSLPVLLISGGDDPVGGRGWGVRRTYDLFRRAGMRRVTLKLYPGARHELLNETNRSQVRRDVLQFIESCNERQKRI